MVFSTPGISKMKYISDLKYFSNKFWAILFIKSIYRIFATVNIKYSWKKKHPGNLYHIELLGTAAVYMCGIFDIYIRYILIYLLVYLIYLAFPVKQL